MTRRRVAALCVALLLLTIVGVFTLLHSRTADCAYSAPVPSLAPELRALGGFDQPQDANDETMLGDDAVTAATALHPDLIGVSAQHSVSVAAQASATAAAVVVPLQRVSTGQSAVVGLVSFLRDCDGRVYFSQVDDLATKPLSAFPAVRKDQALLALGSSDAALVFSDSPFAPTWRDPQSGRTTPA